MERGRKRKEGNFMQLGLGTQKRRKQRKRVDDGGENGKELGTANDYKCRLSLKRMRQVF